MAALAIFFVVCGLALIVVVGWSVFSVAKDGDRHGSQDVQEKVHGQAQGAWAQRLQGEGRLSTRQGEASASASALIAFLIWAVPLAAQVNFPLNVTVEWEPNPITDNVIRYDVTIDAANPIAVLPSACSATACQLPFSIANEGPHTVNVRAVNDWGASTPGTVTFTARGPQVVKVKTVRKS